MAFPSVTYTFSNSTTADATQVNQNFTDLINGLSDTTKSISISALTTASTATLGAAVILGSGTSNDLTFNGSIATSIPVKTNTSFDVGSATLGLRSVYIGGSSTYTCRIIGGTQSATYTITLPTAVPATTSYVLMDNAGALSTRASSAPTVQRFTATGTQTGYYFVITSANATVGATYTNNAQTFTVLSTIASGTALFCTGTGDPASSGTLTKASGTGDATITFSVTHYIATYTTPTSPAPQYLKVRMVGGGAGGGAVVTNAGANGGDTTFGYGLIAGGGTGGISGSGAGSGNAGGGATVDATGFGISGGQGTGAGNSSSDPGGAGGSSAFGGSGRGAIPSNAGSDAATNSGGGGGGGAAAGSAPGGGGGAGAYVEAIITTPAATYRYSVGTGGAGGAAGTRAGGNGAAGIIIVEEFY